MEERLQIFRLRKAASGPPARPAEPAEDGAVILPGYLKRRF